MAPEPIVNLNWNYGDDPDVHLVAKEINGYTWADKKQVANFVPLKDDGSTACGCWIYSGYYPGPDKKDNKAAARNGKDPSGLGLYPGWSFSWPVNRRIIYNRCSVDAAGQPWNKNKALVGWDAEGKKWVRNDVPDFKWIDLATKVEFAPDESLKAPFLMLPEGKSRLFVPKGLCKDGPFPGALRGPGVPLHQSRVQAAEQPGDQDLEVGLGHGGPDLRPPLPHHRHHLPGHRALAGRGHDQEPRLAVRDDAGDVRGDEPRPGQVQGHQGRVTGSR